MLQDELKYAIDSETMNGILAFNTLYALNISTSVDAVVYGIIEDVYEPVPFSTISKTISKLEFNAVTVSLDEISDDVNWVILVALTNPIVFLTKYGIEPVPFSTISNTTSKLLLDAVINVDGIIDAVVYDVKFVLLTLLSAFVTIVGIEPVPFSIIFNTTSNPLPTFIMSEADAVIDDVIWVSPVILTPLCVTGIIVGIEPVPFDIILITFAKDADTIVLSDWFAELLKIVWTSLVALIPANVVSTIVGIEVLPFFTMFITLVNDFSIGAPSIAITLLKSLANLIASTVSCTWTVVASDGNLK